MPPQRLSLPVIFQQALAIATEFQNYSELFSHTSFIFAYATGLPQFTPKFVLREESKIIIVAKGRGDFLLAVMMDGIFGDIAIARLYVVIGVFRHFGLG